jgi:hypothetical protein
MPQTEIPEHRELPADEWWVCHYPERVGTRVGQEHFRPGCPYCWIGFKAAYQRNPLQTFTQPDSAHPNKLLSVQSPIEDVEEWFMSTGQFAKETQ